MATTTIPSQRGWRSPYGGKGGEWFCSWEIPVGQKELKFISKHSPWFPSQWRAGVAPPFLGQQVPVLPASILPHTWAPAAGLSERGLQVWVWQSGDSQVCPSPQQGRVMEKYWVPLSRATVARMEGTLHSSDYMLGTPLHPDSTKTVGAGAMFPGFGLKTGK